MRNLLKFFIVSNLQKIWQAIDLMRYKWHLKIKTKNERLK